MHVFHLLAVGDLSFDPRQEPLSAQTLLKMGTGSDQDGRCRSPLSTSAVGGVITMGKSRLGVGTEWLLDGRAWRVVRQLAFDRFVTQDTKSRIATQGNESPQSLRIPAGFYSSSLSDTANGRSILTRPENPRNIAGAVKNAKTLMPSSDGR